MNSQHSFQSEYWMAHTCIAVSMHIILSLLDGIYLIRDCLYIFRLVWGDLLNTLCLPVDVLPICHGILAL